VARISETFEFSDLSNMTMETLILNLDRMYKDLATALNSKPDLYERTTDGQTNETFLAQGSININISTNKVEMLTNHQATTVTWTTI
jgi:hypothetical protein